MSETTYQPAEGNVVSMPFAVFERMHEYQRAVQERLMRATKALDDAEVPYAVIGGNAVGTYVAEVDEAATRSTNDVDLLLNRADLDLAKEALSKVGFVYRHAASIDMFLDGPDGRAKHAIHVIFAGEKVKAEYLDAAPDLTSFKRAQRGYATVTLEALVRMKLTSYRMKDRVHLQDLMGVGLLDETWMDKVPEALRPRMREVLDTPHDDI